MWRHVAAAMFWGVLGGCALPRTVDVPAKRSSWVKSLRREVRAPSNNAACVASEAAAIAQTLATSPEAARFEGQARALAAQSKVSFADAPELRLNNLRLDRLIGGPERAELALRVPVARPGTLTGEQRLLEAEAEVAQARAAIERAQLAAEVRVLWARLQHAVEAASIAGDGEARHAALAEGARRGVGLSALDRQVLETDYLRAQAERVSAEGEVARWREALGALAGPVCEAIEPVAIGPLAASVEGALATRAELSRLFAEKEHAELSQAVAERKAWPWLEWFQVGYEVDRGFAPDTFGFALAVSLPIGAWSGAEVEAERVRARGIEREAGLWVRRIEAEVTAAQRQLEARLAELARHEALLAALPVERIDALRAAAPTEVLADDISGLHRDRSRLLRAAAEARLGVLEARARLLAAMGRAE